MSPGSPIPVFLATDGDVQRAAGGRHPDAATTPRPVSRQAAAAFPLGAATAAAAIRQQAMDSKQEEENDTRRKVPMGTDSHPRSRAGRRWPFGPASDLFFVPRRQSYGLSQGRSAGCILRSA